MRPSVYLATLAFALHLLFWFFSWIFMFSRSISAGKPLSIQIECFGVGDPVSTIHNPTFGCNLPKIRSSLSVKMVLTNQLENGLKILMFCVPAGLLVCPQICQVLSVFSSDNHSWLLLLSHCVKQTQEY